MKSLVNAWLILGRWLKYRRSYHLKLEKNIYWGFWYVYRWSRRVDSHFRTVLYRYAIVREIVAFAIFTINYFLRQTTTDFFSKMSKNKCIISAKWLSQESYKPWLMEFDGKIKMPLFPMWQTYWHWHYGWLCPKIAHEKRSEKWRCKK